MCLLTLTEMQCNIVHVRVFWSPSLEYDANEISYVNESQLVDLVFSCLDERGESRK